MKIINKITGFLSEVKLELTKVSWSTREQIMDATIVVIGVTGLLAVCITVTDLALSKILSAVFK